MRPQDLYGNPNALAADYSEFDVSRRLLLTGHSHQAWPNCSFSGQQQAWRDASKYVDEKWAVASEKAEQVRRGFARILDDDTGFYSLSSNTHDLLVRFLWALPLDKRPKLVTTDGEFHTIRRQLDRLAETGLEIVKIPQSPVDTVCERLMEATDEKTAAVLCSAVFFRTGQIASHFGSLLETCQKIGAELLIDAYHALNVVPFSIKDLKLDGAFVVGGGYKYCQLGEGNCFLRFPVDCSLRPVITGWYSEFDLIERGADETGISYGRDGLLFAGSTYDPTSHYRAVCVFDFFKKRGLTPDFLRTISSHQVGLLADRFDKLDIDPSVITRDHSTPLSKVGGFLVLNSPKAGEFSAELAKRGVLTDFRGTSLRLGPAPYLSDSQLEEAMDILGELSRD